MTDAESTKIVKLLELDQEERRERDVEMLGEIRSTREMGVAMSSRMDLHEKDDKHTHTTITSRIDYLEDRADATGRNVLTSVETERDELKRSAKEWRGRIASVLVTFFTTAAIALVGYYLTHR